jgi:hypothetical protein
MCFSPTVSFGASVVLAGVGVAALARARTVPQRVLSTMPILFAIQQLAEGVLWMSLLHPAWAHWEKAATYGFLFFAQIVWPVFMPLAVLLFENNPRRKKIIMLFSGIGVILAAYLTYCLYRYPIAAVIGDHHIKYEQGFSLASRWYFGLLYFIPTIMAPIMSSIKRLRWLGYLFLASYLVSRVLFHFFVISVWCFFGAIISLIVLAIVSNLRGKEKAA